MERIRFEQELPRLANLPFIETQDLTHFQSVMSGYSGPRVEHVPVDKIVSAIGLNSWSDVANTDGIEKLVGIATCVQEENLLSDDPEILKYFGPHYNEYGGAYYIASDGRPCYCGESIRFTNYTCEC